MWRWEHKGLAPLSQSYNSKGIFQFQSFLRDWERTLTATASKLNFPQCSVLLSSWGCSQEHVPINLPHSDDLKRLTVFVVVIVVILVSNPLFLFRKEVSSEEKTPAESPRGLV